MSGLAAVLAQHGYRVTGSDMQSSEVVDRLGRQGIRVQVGHGVEHLPGQVDCLVVSAAVKGDNPEVLWAKERGIRICIRGDAGGADAGNPDAGGGGNARQEHH